MRDSNPRPLPCEGSALTNCANRPRQSRIATTGAAPASGYDPRLRQGGPMPEYAEVADGLKMPLADAMRTQRAVRRLRPDPVDDETLIAVLELATKAPTGSNEQGWEFVVVRDPDVKHALARLNRQAFSVYRRFAPRQARGGLKGAPVVPAGRGEAAPLREPPGMRGAS